MYLVLAGEVFTTEPPEKPSTSSLVQIFSCYQSPDMQEAQVQFLGQEDSLEKGMAIHSSILTWRIPGIFQYSCLQNPMDRGAWQIAIHGVTELNITEWLTLLYFSLYSSLTRTITCQSYPIIIKLADSTSLCQNLLSMFRYQVLEMQLFIQSYSDLYPEVALK